MTELLVPTTRTTPTLLAFATALLGEWPFATKEGAGVLYAHFAGETSDGKACWNWNLGNMKYSMGCGLNFCSLANVWEGFLVKDEDGDGDIDEDDRELLVERMIATGLWMRDGSASHAAAVGKSKVSLVATPVNRTTLFRAYDSLEAGMAPFVSAKRNPISRYATAWRFVLDGDCDGYARELGRKGYFTASPDVYARVMLKKHAVWMASSAYDDALASLGLDPAPPPPAPLEDIPPFARPDLPLPTGGSGDG